MQNEGKEIEIQEDLIECEHKDLIHNVICKICYMLLQKPILVCTNCGYFACKSCIKNWQRSTLNQNCPQKCSSNSTFLEKQIPQLEKIFNWITIKCPNSQNEQPDQCCNVIMKYNEIKEHVPHCQFQLVKCKFVNCGKKFCIKDIDFHYNNCEFNRAKCQFCLKLLRVDELEKHLQDCDYRIIKCSNLGCTMNMQYIKRNAHMEQCKFRIVQCQLCNESIQFKSKEEHLKSQCSYRDIPCSLCNVQIIQKDEQTHKQLCPQRNVCCEDCQQMLKFQDLKSHTEIDCIKTLNKRLETAQAQKETCLQEIQQIYSYLNQNQNIQ